MAPKRVLRLDIVGDVHGQLEVLKDLLAELGYQARADGRLIHPDDRRLVFIGDLVDRGPNSFEVAEIVRRACAGGEHLCLLGNHEFNLVEWRRGRLGAKTSNRPTTTEIEGSGGRWNPILDFFETLPVALELEDLRITHAVWHQGCFEVLAPVLTQASPGTTRNDPWARLIRLDSPYARGASRAGLSADVFPGQAEPALQVFLKGHEVPAEESFRDNDGRPRDKERARWWLADASDVPRDKRVVFGHYWNLPPIPGHHEAFCPPFSSGHPKLREWAWQLHELVPARGRVLVPSDVRAVCIDYNGVTNAGDRACVGAYRHPEAEVVWVARPIVPEPGP